MTAKFFSCFILGLFFLLFFSPPLLQAGEYQWGVEITESYLSQTYYLDRYQNQFSYEESSNLIGLGPNFQFEMGEGISGYFRGYLYWSHLFNGDQFETRDSDLVDIYLSDTYLEFKNRKWSSQLGLKPVQFGKGLIFSDDAVAASIQFKNGPLYFDIYGARVMDNSPILGGSIGYRLGMFQQIETFALYYEDREDAFSRTVYPLLSVSDLTNEGYLSWFGVSADLFMGNIYLTAVGIYQQGQMEFFHLLERFNRNVSAYLFDVGIETNLTEQLSLGLFCFTASGDNQPLRDDFSAFISPLPYNSRASIFFDPNFVELDETNSLIFGGTTAHGVIAPGLAFTIEPLQDLLIEGKAVSFYPQSKPSTQKSWYGWEVDLEISYRFKDNTIIFIEIDRFEHGDFFKTKAGYEPEAAVRLSIGIQMPFLPPKNEW